MFTAGGSQGTVFAMAPLAVAARNAGHDVLTTVDAPLLECAQAIGLPAVQTPHPKEASARLQALLEVSQDWTPDVVVGGLSYIPGLLAASLDVLYVRQYWDILPLRTEPGLQVELDRLGLSGAPEADLFLDVCPPGLRPSPSPTARPMRWIPRNRQGRLEPWMYTRPKDRPRVLITSGTRSLMLNTPGSSMRHLVDQLISEGAEVVFAAPEGAAEQFAGQLGDVHIGWLPLDVVAPTCDLAIHHGGGATAVTFMNAGVAQVVIPENDYAKAIGAAAADFGVAQLVLPAQLPEGINLSEEIAGIAQDILSTPRYQERADELAAHIRTLPLPSQIVLELEELS
ncbi:glycosyltransferase [Kineosporia babensis]|uniref:glycosyltransferase n=1 Tax=Kineosporia babensis TaxID=499548 RepID=UPI0038B3A5FC